MPNLFISLKNNAHDLANMMRQIENWANSSRLTGPLPLAAGWSGTVQYVLSPFNQVQLRGNPSFAGTPVDSQLILTLPRALRPPQQYRFVSIAVRATCFIDVNTNGTVAYRTATDPTPLNANPSLSPCIFFIG